MGALNRTPLYDLHLSLGAKMVEFAGYEMPVQYPMGVLKEHLHTRTAAGLFDVSHMGQVLLRSGAAADAARALETLVPVDVLGLKEGRQRYALFTNDGGGIEDDLMVANRGDHLFLVVNAARKAADLTHMRARLDAHLALEEVTDRALLALQGPEAEAATSSRSGCYRADRPHRERRETGIPGATEVSAHSARSGNGPCGTTVVRTTPLVKQPVPGPLR